MDNSEIVFYNYSEDPVVDQEIKVLRDAIKIPNYHDLIEELNVARLKST